MFRVVVLSAVAATAFAAPAPINPQLDGRIIGGANADIKDHKHQVSLLWFGVHICGGSIIGPTFIVTAAHCTYGDTAEVLSVRAGSSDLNTGGRVVKVKKLHQHLAYDTSTTDYDIAVLELAEALTADENIGVIALPVKDAPIDVDVDAVTSGWGSTSEGGQLSKKLQAVTIKTISIENCKTAYGDDKISDRMTCAGILDGGGKDTCQGDSGGPLVVGNLLVGVVSWGYGCAQPKYPGVYASVPKLRDYITETAGI